MLVPGHELSYSSSVGVLPLFLSKGVFTTTVDGEGMDVLYDVPRSSCSISTTNTLTQLLAWQ